MPKHLRMFQDVFSYPTRRKVFSEYKMFCIRQNTRSPRNIFVLQKPKRVRFHHIRPVKLIPYCTIVIPWGIKNFKIFVDIKRNIFHKRQIAMNSVSVVCKPVKRCNCNVTAVFSIVLKSLLIISGRIKSSLSINAIYLPFAALIPTFLVSATPPFSFSIETIFG